MSEYLFSEVPFSKVFDLLDFDNLDFKRAYKNFFGNGNISFWINDFEVSEVLYKCYFARCFRY
ncbi:MAG: hypothetical protein GON13_01095 [Nanoarchaeota archaeon]|nr:hypothetical protein [Nanoarchaeota archaeon]